MAHFFRRVFVLLVGLALVGSAAAQTAPVPAVDTAGRRPVQIDFAEVYERIVDGEITSQRLAGEVELRQGELFIYTDEAVIRGEDFVRARGNVVLLQNDTLQLFADSMRYYANQELAFLYGNVVLVNGEQRLFTDSLRYDLAARRARYRSRAKLTDGRAQLSSMRGTYDANAKLASFRDSVFVVGEDFSLLSDTLRFATEARVVYFDGPTLVATPTSRVYAEDGYYDMIDSAGVFRRRAQVARGTQRAMADEIFYDGVRDEFQLVGDARFVDEQRRAVGDTIRYFERTDRTQLLGDAVFVDGDQRVDGERIDYDGTTQTFSSTGRVNISEPPFLLAADSVSFDEALGLAFLRGEVFLHDTLEQRSLVADRVDYRRDNEYVKAYGGRPVFTMVVEGDSLHMTADTLLSYREAFTSYAAMRAAQVARGDTLTDADLDSLGVVRLPGGDPDTAEASPNAATAEGDSILVSLPDAVLRKLTDTTQAVAAGRMPIGDPIVDSTASRQNALDSAGKIDVDNRLEGQALVPLPTDTTARDSFLVGPTLAGDTLLTPRPKLPDSVRSILAYRDVRVYKSNLQAVSDSLAFNSIDSAFTLYGDPLVWSDTSQFLADTIVVRLRNEVVDRVLLRSAALIVNSPDDQFFNQIKGRQVDVDFVTGEIDAMSVRGNAESVYYILDEEKAYIGVNHVKSARMRLAFADGELSDIYFHDRPEGALEPIPPKGAAPKLLEDFRWEEALRPKSKADLQ